jgi:hypothetical protein
MRFGGGQVPAGQPRGRTGDEPATALSALRLRVVLAAIGSAFSGVVAAGALTTKNAPVWLLVTGVALTVLALVGAIDIVVVLRRRRRDAASLRAKSRNDGRARGRT